MFPMLPPYVKGHRVPSFPSKENAATRVQCGSPGKPLRNSAPTKVSTGADHEGTLCLADTKIPPHPQKGSNCSA